MSSARSADRLVTAGGALFLVGAVATLATVAPLLLGADRLPTVVYVVAVVGTALGFLLALVGMLRGNRARRRARGR
ncbi:hypothetical protein [Vallicoccus soli]|uniref:Integral membrane protein n=1 Tax=Vallicoccus soli TaxID=2339232 RepID=A0A3A3Z9N1_9ACTN|nr:hypothetical protein [Vallicoccus soli]RJK97796.1 hypothetical protein D5H78_02065 [Vallicoccus soli]